MPYAFGVGWLIDISLLLHLEDASRAFQIPVATVAIFGVLGLAKDVGWLAFVASRKQPITIGGQSIRLPSLRDALVQIAFGVVQISLMSTILYLFMPPELNMTWPAFVAIYCLAFVAGQMSNVPVGLGVLEAALFLMLPQVPPGKLVGAVLAYRAVYEVLPLMRALVLLLIYETTNPAGIVEEKQAQRHLKARLRSPGLAVARFGDRNAGLEPPGTASYCSTCVAPTCDVKNPSSVSSFIIRTNGRLRCDAGTSLAASCPFSAAAAASCACCRNDSCCAGCSSRNGLPCARCASASKSFRPLTKRAWSSRRIHVLEDHVDERRHADIACARRVGARNDQLGNRFDHRALFLAEEQRLPARRPASANNR